MSKSFAKWFTAILLLIWGWKLLSILIKDDQGVMALTTILRPDLWWLPASAGVISLLFAWATVITNAGHNHNKHSFTLYLKRGIIIIPIFFANTALNYTLGEEALQKRFTESNKGSLSSSQKSYENNLLSSKPSKNKKDTTKIIPQKHDSTPPQETQTNPIASTEWWGFDDDGYMRTTLYDILKLERDKNIGVKVSLVGMAATVTEKSGKKRGVFYRFFIGCCAADAAPLHLEIPIELAEKFEKNQWVRLRGTFTVEGAGKNERNRILNPLIDKTEKPQNPYLTKFDY